MYTAKAKRKKDEKKSKERFATEPRRKVGKRKEDKILRKRAKGGHRSWGVEERQVERFHSEVKGGGREKS